MEIAMTRTVAISANVVPDENDNVTISERLSSAAMLFANIACVMKLFVVNALNTIVGKRTRKSAGPQPNITAHLSFVDIFPVTVLTISLTRR